VIGALSYALDLTEGEPSGHAARSCMIGMRLAQVLRLDPETRLDLFYALLLEAAGLGSTQLDPAFGFVRPAARRVAQVRGSGVHERQDGAIERAREATDRRWRRACATRLVARPPA
jgi:hypothetical protein